MHEAKKSLQRCNGISPAGKAYARGESCCIVAFRLGVDQPGSRHFSAEFSPARADLERSYQS